MEQPKYIGRYEIQSKIASGGMAVVYRARDPRVNRPVAVKVLHQHLAENPHIRERFKREAETIATLEHPAIVPLYDFGEEDDNLYLVMRYMGGGSLADRLNNAQLPVNEAAQIMQRVGSALAQAHALNVIHRDLKPGNILFDPAGQAYLSDFGIARLLDTAMTATDVQLGTPAYMSPEQVQTPKQVDYRSDIYGLGIILFEMLTGQRPFTGDTPIEQATARIFQPVPHIRDFNAALPAGWEIVIQRALAREKTRRYQSVAELVADVVAVANGRDPAASPPSPTDPTEIEGFYLPPSIPIASGGSKARVSSKSENRKRPLRSIPVIAAVLLVLAGLLGVMVSLRNRDGTAATSTPMIVAVADTVTPTGTTPPSLTPIPTFTLTPPATPTSRPTQTPSPLATAIAVTTTLPQLRVTIGTANVRQGPGVAYAVLTTLRAGDIVTVLGRDANGRWFNVELADNRTGWLAAEVVEFVDASTSETIPVVTAAPVSATARATMLSTAFPTSNPTLPPATAAPTANPTLPPATAAPTADPTLPPATAVPTFTPPPDPPTATPTPIVDPPTATPTWPPPTAVVPTPPNEG